MFHKEAMTEELFTRVISADILEEGYYGYNAFMEYKKNIKTVIERTIGTTAKALLDTLMRKELDNSGQIVPHYNHSTNAYKVEALIKLLKYYNGFFNHSTEYEKKLTEKLKKPKLPATNDNISVDTYKEKISYLKEEIDSKLKTMSVNSLLIPIVDAGVILNELESRKTTTLFVEPLIAILKYEQLLEEKVTNKARGYIYGEGIIFGICSLLSGSVDEKFSYINQKHTYERFCNTYIRTVISDAKDMFSTSKTALKNIECMTRLHNELTYPIRMSNNDMLEISVKTTNVRKCVHLGDVQKLHNEDTQMDSNLNVDTFVHVLQAKLNDAFSDVTFCVRAAFTDSTKKEFKLNRNAFVITCTSPFEIHDTTFNGLIGMNPNTTYSSSSITKRGSVESNYLVSVHDVCPDTYIDGVINDRTKSICYCLRDTICERYGITITG